MTLSPTPGSPDPSDEDHTLPEPESAADTSFSAVSWPPLRWRGDLTKRHLTAGTLLQIIYMNNGAPTELGLTISTLELELRRVAHKYRGKDSSDIGYDKTINGDKLYTDSRAIRSMIHALVFLTGAVQYVSDAGETFAEDFTPADHTAVRLTSYGVEIADAAFERASSDTRFEHIDLSDPIIEFDCTTGDLDGTLVETLGIHESTLPNQRTVSEEPSYRQWLWIVLHNPITFAVLYSGVDPSHPDLYTVGSVEGSDHIVASFSEAQKPFTGPGEDTRLPANYWAARVQAEFIRPFAREVLSGGPDLMWAGKPIKPSVVHSDVELFAAAGAAGFQPQNDMVRRSALAIELFAKGEFTLGSYGETRTQMDAAQLDASVITVTHLPEASADDDLGASDLKTDKRGVIGLPKVEKLIMKKSADSLMDDALGRSVTNPHDALSGKFLKVRCDYILNAKDPNKRRACDRWAVKGSTRCETHGGEYLDEEETKNLLKANQQKLWAMSSKAIDTVGELMLNSTNDSVRLAAAKLIMDRSGFNEAIDISVQDTGPVMENPADIIRDRLRRLGISAAAMVPDEPAELEQAIDAEFTAERDDDEDGDGVLVPV